MSTKSTTIQASPAAATPTATETTADVAQAKLQYDPQMAKLSYDIAANPEYGIFPYTQLLEQTRANVLPEETAVREQLTSNILANLISPTGISAKQQQSIDLRRGKSQSELVRALRERANLGGGLYGGRSAKTEQNAVSDLQAAFSEEDINREETARLNAIQAALPLLSILYPEIAIAQPQFQSAAPTGSAALQSAMTARGQDINAAIAQAQNQAQLQSALYGGLGQAVGGWTSGSAFNNLLTK